MNLRLEHILFYCRELEEFSRALERAGLQALRAPLSSGGLDSALYGAGELRIEVQRHPEEPGVRKFGPFPARIIGFSLASDRDYESLLADVQASGVRVQELKRLSGARVAAALSLERCLLLHDFSSDFQIALTPQFADARPDLVQDGQFEFLSMKVKSLEAAQMAFAPLVSVRRVGGDCVADLSPPHKLRFMQGEGNRVQGVYLRQHGAVRNLLSHPEIVDWLKLSVAADAGAGAD